MSKTCCRSVMLNLLRDGTWWPEVRTLEVCYWGWEIRIPILSSLSIFHIIPFFKNRLKKLGLWFPFGFVCFVFIVLTIEPRVLLALLDKHSTSDLDLNSPVWFSYRNRHSILMNHHLVYTCSEELHLF